MSIKNEFCLTDENGYWTLSIWTKNIGKAHSLLQRTYSKRSLNIDEIPVSKIVVKNQKTHQASDFDLGQAYFFENSSYEFEFRFSDDVDKTRQPETQYHLESINQSFRFIQKDNVLRGTIQSANDVGMFSLPLNFTLKNGTVIRQILSFDILPCKMAMNEDLNQIYQQLDNEYPLWRFAFAKPTQQGSKRSQSKRQSFELLWLANFESLYTQFIQELKRIIYAPHNRLLVQKRYIQLERLKGKLSIKVQERARQQILNGHTHSYIEHIYQQLSSDTPENRFIKYTLQYSIARLNTIQKHVKQQYLDKISTHFFSQLQNWQRDLQQKLNNPLFQKVGNFQGLQQISLVLQQKIGYRGVFQIWQQWKTFLDTLDNQARVGMKSIAEIYEIWCFLNIKNTLENLGFKTKEHKVPLLKQDYLEQTLKDGLGSAFILERGKTQIRLAHEPYFKQNTLPYFSCTVTQKPDIVLEVLHDDLPQLLWIFDAKYRVETYQDNQDYVPEDAINQMHRYRDAILLEYRQQKTRPVFGAFALYPAFYEQKKISNPYQTMIDAVNIGAFAVLPSSDDSHQFWLKQFLIRQLGEQNYPTENIYQQESIRIMPTGFVI